MKKFMIYLAALAMMLSTTFVRADERGTKEEATAMVERGLAHIKRVGAEQAFKDFSDKGNADWHVKDVYLFCYDLKAVNTCHGANSALIGKDLSDMKTADGQLLIKNMIAMTREKGNGWITYEWSHPQTKKVEPKQAFVKRIPDTEGFIGAGVYR